MLFVVTGPVTTSHPSWPMHSVTSRCVALLMSLGARFQQGYSSKGDAMHGVNRMAYAELYGDRVHAIARAVASDMFGNCKQTATSSACSVTHRDYAYSKDPHLYL